MLVSGCTYAYADCMDFLLGMDTSNKSLELCWDAVQLQSTSDAPLYISGTPNSIQIGQNLVAFSADTGQGIIQGDNPFESFG